MYHYFGQAKNQRGDGLPNWQIEIVEVDTDTIVPIFADESGTPIETVSGVTNRAISNSLGNYDFYVTDGIYDIRPYNEAGVAQEQSRYVIMRTTAGEAQTAADTAVAAALAATTGDLNAALDVMVEIMNQCGCDTPIAAVQPDGWQALINNPTDLSLTDLVVVRDGFGITGDATKHVDTLKLTKIVREAYPNQDTLTADKQALSDYVYSTDSIFGSTNSSTVVSPKPHMQWLMKDRLVVGDTVHAEISAFHRDGMACVRVRATDGTTTTDWQTVSAQTLSSYCEDVTPTYAYIADIDVSGLTDGAAIRLQAEGLPLYGGAASIRSTSDETAHRLFSERYFWRDTARAAAPPIAYLTDGTGVNPIGDDATGVWSTTDATALANPFLTPKALLEAIEDQPAATGDYADGCIVFVDGSFVLASTGFGTTIEQKLAGITFKSAPGVDRANAELTLSSTFRPRLANGAALEAGLTESSLIFEDISFRRTGAGNLGINGGEPEMFVQWRNCNFDNGSQSSTYMSSSNVHDAVFGMTVTNMSVNGAIMGITGTSEHRIWRGLFAADFAGASWQATAIVGSKLTNAGQAAFPFPDEGTFVLNADFPSPSGSLITLNASAHGTEVERVCIVQGATDRTTDSDGHTNVVLFGTTGDSSHVILWHNTLPGADIVGRSNYAYDNQSGTSGQEQAHTLWSVKGNIWIPNIKADEFNQIAATPGNFALLHGVGCEGNYSMYGPEVPTTENPDYAGIYSVLGVDNFTLNDPLFTDYQGSTSDGAGNVTAGAGGSDLTLQATSPARGLVSTVLYPVDLAGTSRGTGTQNAGAYA